MITPRPKRLPITPALLRRIREAWSQDTLSSDHFMLWAAFCLGFFGFLRAGEFTCPSQSAFTTSMLQVCDVSVDSHYSPTHMQVRLRCSKTDPFGSGFVLHLGCTNSELCPVVAMLGYLARRPQVQGFLFVFMDGSTLSRPRLCHELHRALQSAGLDTSGYSGHRFRIGAATSAARMGLSDSLIQTLGRWKSAAFLSYIRTDNSTLARVSATLAEASV